MIVGPRFHVPSRAVILAGTLSLVVDGVMVGISFHVEVGVVPQFDSCRSTDGTALGGFTKRCGFPQTWSDAQHLCAERLLSLSHGRAFAVPYGERCPLPALIFHTALSIPRSQLSHCVPLCCSSGVLHSTTCGIGPLSLLLSCPSLVSDSRATLPLLLVLPPFAWTLASAGPHQIVCGRSC